MLRMVGWATRSAGFVLVGALVFTSSTSGTGARTVQIVAFTLLGLALCGWALLDVGPADGRHRGRWYPLALGVIAACAGLACTTLRGDVLIVFAFVAVVSAGSEIGTLGGCAVLGVGALAIEVGSIAFGESVAGRLGYPMLLVSGWLIGRNRRSYRVQAEQSAALVVQMEQLQSQQRRVDVLDERARIAREIHDVLAHSLGALSIQIQAARAVLTDRHDVAQALEVLGTAQQLATDGLVETRHAVTALRTDTLPLDMQLRQLAGVHAEQHRSQVSFDGVGEPRPFGHAANLALLRAAQESLVNAAKYAPHQGIDIRLDYGQRSVRLTVANTYTGPPAPAAADPVMSTINGGYGLTGMRERLQLLGGTLVAGPRAGRWIVTAELPNAASTIETGGLRA